MPPIQIQLKDDFTNQILPGHISKNEVVVDDDHLIESGYVGEPPSFHLRIRNFLIYAQPPIYKDYWLRLKLPRKVKPNLYSIFKER